MPTGIEWCEETWNPVTGCTPVSEGCRNCYAQRHANRMRGKYGYPADEPFRVTLHADRLDIPLHWRKPRRIFVCSMGDLFHVDVDDVFRDKVFRIAYICPRHTFLILTKRPEEMARYLGNFRTLVGPQRWGHRTMVESWPLPNVWLGTSVEDQEMAEKRIPYLVQCKAAVLFVSYEPALGAVQWGQWLGTCGDDQDFNWLICGGESGPGARPMDPEWARQARDACELAGVPFFMKQMGGHPNKRAKLAEIPSDLRIREYPK